jgi:hypothetical protein
MAIIKPTIEDIKNKIHYENTSNIFANIINTFEYYNDYFIDVEGIKPFWLEVEELLQVLFNELNEFLFNEYNEVSYPHMEYIDFICDENGVEIFKSDELISLPLLLADIERYYLQVNPRSNFSIILDIFADSCEFIDDIPRIIYNWFWIFPQNKCNDDNEKNILFKKLWQTEYKIFFQDDIDDIEIFNSRSGWVIYNKDILFTPRFLLEHCSYISKNLLPNKLHHEFIKKIIDTLH